ncbi:MAG: hypothetical protein JJT85_03605 [Chromatiales bacterium]|nr:hypothetical protein [Chromatiales bacterium]
MTVQGKLNLLGLLLLPLAATVAALLVFGLRTDTLLAVFAMNLLPVLLAAPLAGLLLLAMRHSTEALRWLAVLPTLLPAAWGSAWYLLRAAAPNRVAPGVEYIAGPTYLLVAVLLLLLVIAPACLLLRRRATYAA